MGCLMVISIAKEGEIRIREKMESDKWHGTGGIGLGRVEYEGNV